MRALLLVTCLCAAARCAAADAPPAPGSDAGVARAKQLWAQSPHGPMLERILPPSIGPDDLPEPGSEGARLTARYCVQCHHLPNPEMHTPARWNNIVVRMVWREGRRVA